MNLYVDSDVENRRFEFLDVIVEVTDFWAWCSRMCSWNLFLKLKFCSQCLQITFEQLICFVCSRSRVIDENWTKHSTHEWYWDGKFDVKIDNFAINSSEIIENAHARLRSKFCIVMKLDWLLNHANANLRKHLKSRTSTSDFWYKSWFWICWKCCKKSITLLYRSNFKISHMSVESNISISTKIDVDFEISMIFCWAFCSINSAFAFHLIWHSVNLISRCVCFWIFCSANWVFFCFWTFWARSALRLTRSTFCSISLISSQKNLWTSFFSIKIILCQVIKHSQHSINSYVFWKNLASTSSSNEKVFENQFSILKIRNRFAEVSYLLIARTENDDRFC